MSGTPGLSPGAAQPGPGQRGRPRWGPVPVLADIDRGRWGLKTKTTRSRGGGPADVRGPRCQRDRDLPGSPAARRRRTGAPGPAPRLAPGLSSVALRGAVTAAAVVARLTQQSGDAFAIGERRRHRRKRTPGRRNDAKTSFFRRTRHPFMAPRSPAGLRRGPGGQPEGSGGAQRGLHRRRAGAARRQGRARQGFRAAGGVERSGALPGPRADPGACGSQRARGSGQRCPPRTPTARPPARPGPVGGRPRPGFVSRRPGAVALPPCPAGKGRREGMCRRPRAGGGLNTARRDALPGASDRHRRGPAAKNNPL